jgi:hypothetical protein
VVRVGYGLPEPEAVRDEVRCYAMGSQTRSAEIIQAFADGVKGEVIREGRKYPGGDVAVWGLLRGAKELRKEVKDSGFTYYAVDHGYIGREESFRVTRNGFQQTEIVDRPLDRWQRLKDKYRVKPKEWRKGGSYILLAMSSTMVYEYFDDVGWQGTIEYHLKNYSDRPVVVRKKHDRESLQSQLEKAWCVVTHASMVAVDAVIAGVPVFVTGPSIARPMGLTDLKKIEEPVFPEREAWFRSLAYAQFTMQDMRKGLVKPLLDENPFTYDHWGR